MAVSRKDAAVLAVLALDGPQPRERLAALIWPGFPVAVPWLATLCTIPAALLTGLFFSWLPASRAARQDPVTSLRSGQWS